MKNIAMLILALAAGLFAGCISRAPVPPMDARITIAPDLDNNVVVTDVRCVGGAGSFMVFQANLVNNCSRPLNVDWKVQWLDADGIEIDSAVSSWNTRTLQPFEIRALKCTAPRQEASDMRFYARKSR
ncbi:MAG: YcfL family protein [Kiritimatiellae bacterium]|nr:YcfL family protein [Kiritimatiellia bacterium]